MPYFYVLNFNDELEHIPIGTYYDIYVQKKINQPILVKEKHDPITHPKIQIRFNNMGDYFIILYKFYKFDEEYILQTPRFIKVVLIGKNNEGNPPSDITEIVDIPSDEQSNDDNTSDVVNNIILDYIENTLGIQYEVQQLNTDLWVNTGDKSFINDINNVQRFGFYDDFVGSIVLTDNVDLENKITTTEFILKRIKLIWSAESIAQSTHNQNEIQSHIQIDQIYLYNVGNNTYYVKIGDIVKDPVNDTVYYSIQNVQELKRFDIVTPNVGIYKLDLHKLNVNIVPKMIKEYYIGG